MRSVGYCVSCIAAIVGTYSSKGGRTVRAGGLDGATSFIAPPHNVQRLRILLRRCYRDSGCIWPLLVVCQAWNGARGSSKMLYNATGKS